MSFKSRGSSIAGALVVLLACSACSRKTDEPEPAPSGPTRGLKPPPEPPAEPEKPPPPAPPPFQFPDEQKPAPSEQPAAEEQPAAADGPPPRDYAGELKGLVGSPSGCLKPRPGAQAPREIAVTVEAVVMESGLISRAYARSSELEDEELACIRARLGSARMQPGVEQAPRTVTTSVSMVLQPGATRVPAAPSDNPTGEPGAPAEGQQPAPGMEQQAPAAQPAPEAPTGYGAPEAPANNPE